MGYHAPDADEVYRYIFMADRQRGLVDGFSWSILFVNDTSAVSRTFLSEFGAELCYRTADRIRFVFFSGLDKEQTEALVRQSSEQGSLLSRILAAAASRFQGAHNDWERPGWDTLRPSAFAPLDSPSDVTRHLSYDTQEKSAMPGSKESLRLAQSLGIGRFVPCFLLFSDAGTPFVRLFPIGRLAAEDAYNRLRGWIDSFYETNRLAISHWAAIETEIAGTCRKLEASVREVENWRRKQALPWETLKKVSSQLGKLRTTSPKSNALRDIANDTALPTANRHVVEGVFRRLESIERDEAAAKEIDDWAHSLLSGFASDMDAVVSRLSRLELRLVPGLPQGCYDLLRAAAAACQGPDKKQQLRAQLTRWWHSPQGHPLSASHYESIRRFWSEYSGRATDRSGELVGNTRDEFSVVCEAALAQPITKEPADAARDVLGRLAAHLCVPAEDTTWPLRTQYLQDYLAGHFADLSTGAPSWLTASQVGTTVLQWGDVVPTAERRKGKAAGWFGAMPKLTSLLAILENATHPATRDMDTALTARRRTAVEDFRKAVADWTASLRAVSGEKQSIWLVAIHSLEEVREDLERTAARNAKTAAGQRYPGGKVSQGTAEHLTQLFDDYDRTVSSIVFPFETDREVLTVTLQRSLPDVAGIAPVESASDASRRRRREVMRVLAASENASSTWTSLREEATRWNSVDALLDLLRKTLGASRVDALVEPPRDSRVGSDEIDLAHDSATGILEQLAVDELLRVDSHLNRNEPRSMLPDTKPALYASILSGVGLSVRVEGHVPVERFYWKEAATLHEKVARGAFDVFLAHNSQDKPTVLRLGDRLQARGIHVWIDDQQIPPGRWFQDVIQAAIRTVKAAAVVLGPAGVGRWQAVELRSFLSLCVERQMPLIPVLLPGCETIPDELAFLRQLTLVRFRSVSLEPEAIRRLIWGITGTLEGQ